MSETPSVKQRINAGEIISIAGVSMNATREELEHAANQYDMFSIDGQHSPFSEEELVAFCAKAEALDMPVQFRIEHTRHTYLIGRYLDLGPTAILVPEVREEATVDEAIKYFYYPQKGKRSWGGTARRGINKRPDRLEYAAWWNDYGVLCIQLESVDAVINCRQLAKPAVDLVNFGPNDLAFDIECYHKPPVQTLDECVQHVVKELNGSGVRVALAIPDRADRQKYIDMGVTVCCEPLG